MDWHDYTLHRQRDKECEDLQRTKGGERYEWLGLKWYQDTGYNVSGTHVAGMLDNITWEFITD